MRSMQELRTMLANAQDTRDFKMVARLSEQIAYQSRVLIVTARNKKLEKKKWPVR